MFSLVTNKGTSPTVVERNLLDNRWCFDSYLWTMWTCGANDLYRVCSPSCHLLYIDLFIKKKNLNLNFNPNTLVVCNRAQAFIRMVRLLLYDWKVMHLNCRNNLFAKKTTQWESYTQIWTLSTIAKQRVSCTMNAL